MKAWEQSWASLVAQAVMDLPTMQVWFLGWEDPLEKGMATHSSILAWKIPWTEEPAGLQSMGSQRVGHNWASKHARGCFHDLPGSPRSLISTCHKLLPRSCVLIAYGLNQPFSELLSSSSFQRALCLSGNSTRTTLFLECLPQPSFSLSALC